MNMLIDLSEEELNDAMLHISVTKQGHRLRIRNSLKIERSKRNYPIPEDTKTDGINIIEEKSQSFKCLFRILKVDVSTSCIYFPFKDGEPRKAYDFTVIQSSPI